MNIRDFEYLITIDELKNFQNAANKCYVSQPALSQQIKKIEEQLGLNIFERDKKGVITTAKGKEIIKYAKDIILTYSKIKNIAGDEEVLKIALIPTICPYLLPLIAKNLNKDFPNVRFFFLEEKTENLMTKLKSGEIDLGIIAHFDNLIDDKTIYHKLYDEEFLLALNKKSKLGEKDFPKIMAQKQLILLEEGNCISDNIKEICSIYSQNSYSDFYATNIETVKNMIKVNNGAALLPKLSCLKEKDLKLISFKEKKYREVGMVFRNSFSSKDLAKKIAKNIQKNNLKYVR